MQNVADNRDFQTFNPFLVLTNRERVEQSLCRMLMTPVARIDNRRISHAREMLWRAGRRVTNHDAIGRHRFEIARGVEQRLAFRDARCRNTDVDGVC